MDVEILVPISLFFCIFMGIFVSHFFNHKRDKERQETIRLAIEKGQELTPEMVNSLLPVKKQCMNKGLRIGLPIMALGLAQLLFGLFGVGQDKVAWSSMFPFFFGAAWVFEWYLNEKKNKQNDEKSNSK